VSLEVFLNYSLYDDKMKRKNQLDYQLDYSLMSLQEIRKDKGLSRAELADKIGDITPQTIYLIETRRQMPGINTAAKISRGLGISLRQFFYSYGIDVSGIPD
jgi:DNA-binding XRE family transcriptional regulator